MMKITESSLQKSREIENNVSLSLFDDDDVDDVIDGNVVATNGQVDE